MKQAQVLLVWLVAVAVFTGIVTTGEGAWAFTLSGTVTNATTTTTGVDGGGRR